MLLEDARSLISGFVVLPYRFYLDCVELIGLLVMLMFVLS